MKPIRGFIDLSILYHIQILFYLIMVIIQKNNRKYIIRVNTERRKIVKPKIDI